jgi:hypothetical protein
VMKKTTWQKTKIIQLKQMTMMTAMMMKHHLEKRSWSHSEYSRLIPDISMSDGSDALSSTTIKMMKISIRTLSDQNYNI